MNHTLIWIMFSEGVPEYYPAGEDELDHLANILLEWEENDPLKPALMKELSDLPLGIVTLVRGRRIVKVIRQQ